MDMWPNVDVEDILPPQYHKGTGSPKKLRFKEHDEIWSRRRRPCIAYRCTKCDKFSHNSRKCHSNEYDPNALKRKRKTPRTKASSNVVEVEEVSETNVVKGVYETNDQDLDPKSQ
ncbi:unnamed protein product [Lathyrus oleraceus]